MGNIGKELYIYTKLILFSLEGFLMTDLPTYNKNKIGTFVALGGGSHVAIVTLFSLLHTILHTLSFLYPISQFIYLYNCEWLTKNVSCTSH